MLANVHQVVVNKKWNEAMLEFIPHKDFLDLTVIYEFIYEDGAKGMMSSRMTYGMMELYEITMEELEQAAKENDTEYIVKSTIEMMYELMPDGHPEKEELKRMNEECKDIENQYVLTNAKKYKGANVILHPDEFEKIAEKVGADLYIIPSSIHEIIVAPVVEEVTKETITAMVLEVNATQLEDVEQLSNHAYYYKRGSMVIEM